MMEMFAHLDAESRIVAAADWHFPGSAATDREIVRGWDGTLYFADDPARLPPLDVLRAELLRTVDSGFEAALVATVTMPLSHPSAQAVALETSALLAVEPDALDSIKVALEARRAALTQAIEQAQTREALEALKAAVAYPV